VTRRFALLLLAVVAATGWLLVPGAGVAEVRGATPNLTIVTTARYDVQPDARRVRVTLDMTLTNRLSDPSTKRYYFDHALLSVLPGVSGLKASWAGAGTPRARVSKRTAAYTLVRIDLAQRLYSHRSASVRLVFDLVDKGGAAGRTVRIGTSLVSFPVWAYATDSTPGSTVRVVFPAGYNVEVQAGAIPSPRTDPSGAIVFQTPKLSKPLAFFAFLVADRPGSYGEQTVHATVGDTPVDLTIHGWVDDPAWTTRVGGLVGRALPLLSERIGLPWPRDGGLIVHETITRSTGGYAGLFDPAAGQIEVAYDAGDEVVLHEAAHTWFNGGLLADRWANEAFASYYGLEAAAALKIKTRPGADTLTPTLEAARIPLNAWGAVGDVDRATEDYAYAASLALAHAIAERAGPDGLRAVWADAAAGVGAYQPPATGSAAASGVGATTTAPETVDGAPDWRGLLDLLDEHGTTSSDDLWRTWVARDEDLELLDARASARTRYAAVLAAAGDWQLPRAVRDAMRAWRFDDAMRLLTAAQAILDQNKTIASGAAAAGLTVPDTLRTAFEGPDGFASATLEATAELEAIARYEAAVAARPTATDVFQDIGLWGSAPEAEVAQARTLFATGDLAGAAGAAGAAASTWSSAGDIGRGRIVSLGALLVALLLVIILLAVWFRGRRRTGPLHAALPASSVATARAALHGGSPAAVDTGSTAGASRPDSYATLAATPDPVEGTAAGDPGARGAEPD
jgi:hypothetical protein